MKFALRAAVIVLTLLLASTPAAVAQSRGEPE